MEILIILLIVSVIVNLFLIRRGNQLITEIEAVQNTLLTEREDILQTLEDMLQEMKDLDMREAFESDDEVGVVFRELKDTIEKYKNII
jgi:predicted PurR-regulated permease PerM